MGVLSERLQAEVEQSEAEIREQISGLDYDELVAWCANWFDNFPDPPRIDIVSIMLRGRDDEEEINAVLDLVRGDKTELSLSRYCYDGLIKAAILIRKNGGTINAEWRDYLLDTLLGVKDTPKAKPGPKSDNWRGEAVCKCISYIVRFTNYRAQRNSEPAHGKIGTPKACAVAIVAESIPPKTYDAIEKIWKNRNRSMFP